MMAVIKVLAALAVLGVLGGTWWLVDEIRSRAAVPELQADEKPEGRRSDGGARRVGLRAGA